MGIIVDKKKFKCTKEQTYPTNPTVKTQSGINQFDMDEVTIKKQQSKK
ncbi:MAG: hypothetical protein ABI295_02665 [Xanthomarina sp.]